MDWSKTENIIFVAVCAAVFAVFLSLFITVAVKGKRRTTGGDIALRIFAALFFAAFAAVVFAAALTRLDGEFKIAAASDGATLFFFGKTVELPIAPVFYALSSLEGLIIPAVCAAVCLIALVTDCILARKKYQSKKTSGARPAKSAKKPTPKTPEEARRLAEIEKIKRLGETAVKKTNDASVSKADVAEQKTESVETDPAREESEDEADFDWRVDNKPAQSSFVGLREEHDDFDSFDSFDEPDASRGQDESDILEIERDLPDYAESEKPTVSEEAEEQTDALEEEITDETSEDGQTQYSQAEQTEYEPEEQPDEPEEQADEPEEQPEESRFGAVNYEQTRDTNIDEVRSKANNAQSDEAEDDFGFDGEVDRSFYIPRIRTIERRAAQAEPKKPAAVKSAKKPAEQKPKDKKSAKKPAKRATAKAPKIEKQEQKPIDKTQDGKRLPVTRRYVIIDRTSAVNIFNNYLIEREQNEDLSASISKIIIK